MFEELEYPTFAVVLSKFWTTTNYTNFRTAFASIIIIVPPELPIVGL